VVGEIEYEVGASLRNPAGLPAVFTNPTTIEQRVSGFFLLALDADRVLRWGLRRPCSRRSGSSRTATGLTSAALLSSWRRAIGT
jgi:hypothetical protein